MIRRLALVLVAFSCACLPAEILQLRQEPLAPGLTFLRGGGGNSLVLVRGERALVFDAKMWPYGSAVAEVVADAGARTVFLVASHLHFNHTGADGLHPGAILVGAPSTLSYLASDRVSPTYGNSPYLPVRRRVTVDVGGEPIVLVHPGPAHTDGDVYAWLPRERVLATGDLFTSGFYPHIDPIHGGSMLGLLAALDELCGYDAKVVIPGHGASTDEAALVAYRDFLRGLRDEVLQRRAKGETDDAIIDALKSPRGEPYRNLGGFSSREDVVRRLVAETRAERKP